MFEWKKLGLVFDPTKNIHASWMSEFAQSPSVVIHSDFVRVYFCCRPLPDENGQYVSRLSYLDLDRNNLLKITNISSSPILELGKMGAFDEHGTYPANIIEFKSDLWAFYCGWSRCESVPVNTTLGVAKSYDGGRTFSRLGDGPVLTYTLNEPFTLGSPKVKVFNDKLYLWYVAGKIWVKTDGRPEPVYKLRMAVSDDGLNWTKHGKDLIESVLEENECQASGEVMFHDGQYHMFFSYRYNLGFKDKGRGYKIGYATSEDLFNWKRADGLSGIKPSKTGWDSNSISYPHIFDLDGNTYMLYQGDEMGRFGFGLAVLKK
jgi:hypothetical protein